MNSLEMDQRELCSLSLNNDSISLVLHRIMVNTITFPQSKGGQKLFKGGPTDIETWLKGKFCPGQTN